jgi:hypothetical protein
LQSRERKGTEKAKSEESDEFEETEESKGRRDEGEK